MSLATPETPMDVLVEALETFHARAVGAEGARIRGMGPRPGVIPDVVRSALAGVQEAMRALTGATAELEPWLARMDVAFAAAEVLGTSARALGEGPLGAMGGWPEPFAGAAGGAAEQLARWGSILEDLELPPQLPSPEDVTRLEAALEQIQGTGGSLGVLVRRVTPTSSQPNNPRSS